MLKPTKRKSRAVAIVLVAGLHGLIFIVFFRGRAERQLPSEVEPAETALFFFDAPTRTTTFDTNRAPVTSRRGLLKLAQPETKAPSVETPFATPESTAPDAVDWAKEAQIAADHQTEIDEQNRRRESSLAPGRFRSEQPPPVAPRFGWDYAATHRTQPTLGGGLVINLSDRCSIAIVFPLVLGGCKIGKIDARGDLFAHMRDLPVTESKGGDR